MRAVGDTVQATFDEDTAEITTLITKGILDKKTIEKQFVKAGKDTHKALDESLKEVESGTKAVVTAFKSATKKGVLKAIPQAIDSYSREASS
jgi:hypothetical protein